MVQQEQLFAHYELDNTKWRAIVLKFLGASLAVHLFLVIAAIYVPAVRDAFYVALLFSDAADMKTVNRGYDLEEIGNDVTVVNLADPNRFRYPDGYFNTGESFVNPSDPTLVATANDLNTGGIATTMPPPDLNAAAPVPTPFPTPIVTTPPVTNFPAVNNPPLARRKNRRAGSLPPLPTPDPNAKLPEVDANAVPKSDDTAKANTNAEPKPSPDKNAMALLGEEEINKQPLIDFGAKVDTLQKEKKIDLNQPFNVVIEGDLEKGGKLVNAAVKDAKGDQQLVGLTTELIQHLNASGILKVFSDVALKDSPQAKHKIKFDVNNDDKNLAVNITFELANADVAYKMQSGVNALIALNRQMRKDKVEGQILQNVRAESDGKMIVFKTLMPRSDAQKLIQDQLAAAVKGKQDATKQ